MSSGALCPECARLVREAEWRGRLYATVVGILTANAATTRAAQYNELKRIADDARLDYEVVLAELQQHQKATHADAAN
jgi:hypothetical protein